MKLRLEVLIDFDEELLDQISWLAEQKGKISKLIESILKDNNITAEVVNYKEEPLENEVECKSCYINLTTNKGGICDKCMENIDVKEI